MIIKKGMNLLKAWRTHLGLTQKEVAKRAGGTALAITTEVGGLPGTDDVFSKFDVLVSSIAGALSSKTGGK